MPAVGRPVSGAAARLAELFEEHAPLVLGLCRGLLRNAHEAEDAAQQTFLSAYRSLLSGNEPREPAAWLATIARNECGSRARQRMREPLPADPGGVEAAADPYAETVRSSDVESLRRVLAQLPRQQRRAFLLREFSGLSYGELAVALGVTEPAVESLLFRARQQLRLSLRGALAPVNGLLWVPLRLRDLLAAAPEAPAAAKVASATAGVALLTTGVVAVAPHRHHHRASSVPAAAPRVRTPGITERPSQHPVAVAADNVWRGSSQEQVNKGSGHHEAGPQEAAKEIEKPKAQNPDEQAAPQLPEQDHSGGGDSLPSGSSGSGDNGSISTGASGSDSGSGSGD